MSVVLGIMLIALQGGLMVYFQHRAYRLGLRHGREQGERDAARGAQ